MSFHKYGEDLFRSGILVTIVESLLGRSSAIDDLVGAAFRGAKGRMMRLTLRAASPRSPIEMAKKQTPSETEIEPAYNTVIERRATRSNARAAEVLVIVGWVKPWLLFRRQRDSVEPHHLVADSGGQPTGDLISANDADLALKRRMSRRGGIHEIGIAGVPSVIAPIARVVAVYARLTRCSHAKRSAPVPKRDIRADLKTVKVVETSHKQGKGIISGGRRGIRKQFIELNKPEAGERGNPVIDGLLEIQLKAVELRHVSSGEVNI